jgi:hypothetical protein
MIILPSRHKDPSRGANKPSDFAVIVNINAEFNPCLIRWQLTPELNAFEAITSPSSVRA